MYNSSAFQSRRGITYQIGKRIAFTFAHDYYLVTETDANNPFACASRLLIVCKGASDAQYANWSVRACACSDPSVLQPVDYCITPGKPPQWISGPSAFGIGSECSSLEAFLQRCPSPELSLHLFKQGLHCIRSAESCGLAVDCIIYNASDHQLMADTSPTLDPTSHPTARLVQSISKNLPKLYIELVRYVREPASFLLELTEKWERSQTPAPGHAASPRTVQPTGPASGSLPQQIIGIIDSGIRSTQSILTAAASSLTPTHGAGAPAYQARHEMPAATPAPQPNRGFSWNSGGSQQTRPAQPQAPANTRPAAAPSQSTRPAAQPQQMNRSPQPQRGQGSQPRITIPQPQHQNRPTAIPGSTNVRPAPVQPTPSARPAPTQSAPNVRPAPVQPAPSVRPAPAQNTPNVRPAPAPAAPSTRPAPANRSTPQIMPSGWEAHKEYRFRALPEIGASCAAVSLSSGALVRFELHSRQEQALHRMVKAVLEQQSDHPIEQTEGLCQLHDVKDYDKSFLIIRDHVDPEGYLPVGHPTLLALELKDKLAIARNMAAIFASLTEAGWLPTRIIESAMLAHPKTHRVLFPDGHLLSRSDDAPLTATLGYAPPESLEGESKATLSAAHYALSVWLYRLFVGGYPLEGRRTIAALEASGKTEEELAPQLYGADAAFCFTGSGDNGVEGLGGRFDEQARRWKALPDALRIAWAKSFISGLHKTPEDRRTPAQWLEIIDGLLKA